MFNSGTRCEKHELPEQAEFPMIWRDFEERGHYEGKRTERVGNETVEVYVWEMMIPVSIRNNLVLGLLEDLCMPMLHLHL